MDAFLAQAESEGIRDSRGVFTIDAAKAEIKLAKFQLATLDHFPRFLLAAATAAGASGLNIVWKNRKTVIHIEGWAITMGDLHAIGMHSLEREARREIHYLAVVLSSIGTRHRFRIVTSDFQVQFEHGTLEFPEKKAADIGPDSMVVEIETQLKREVELGISGQQKFCPFPVRVGGQEFNRGYDPSTETLDSFAFVTRRGDRLPEVSLKYASTHLELPSDDDAPPLALGLAPQAIAESAGLWLLVDELACRADYDLVPSGFYGVVIAPELTYDLSYQLNKNAHYYELQSRLAEAGRKLCLHLRPRASDLPKHQAEVLRRSAEQLGLSWDSGGVHSEAPAGVAYDPFQPVAGPQSIATLLKKLPEMEELRADVLFARYRERISRELRAGRVEEAIVWHLAFLQVNAAMGAVRPEDLVVPHLLRLAQSRTFPTEQAIRELESADGSHLASYLRMLHSWKSQTSSPGIDESWLFPMGTRPRTLAPWMRLWSLLEEGEVVEALGLVRNEDSLHYRGHEHVWLKYFWENYQGQLPWTEQVKIRVGLSFAYPRGTDLDSSQTVAELQQAVVLTEAFRPPFWPHFLTLLRRATASAELSAKDCWVSLLARVLAQHCLASPNIRPLSRPFCPGQE